MNHLDFYEKVMSLRKQGQKAAIATVIRTKGSTPRKTGTKMIVYPDCKLHGTIGGGCGEGEVIEKALLVIETGKPQQHQVDLTEGLLYEDGGICGGIMDVFIESTLPYHS
ncbi:xanthine dehydrogenase accessory factor [Geomicrobium halophilum]|uniref:Xanthine dehydrogenase accessory factor n=1 Tax=Geomicrobium halophilum TaxID=549000 RepID=A0A841PZN9_9BACL|nr:XdhC family protein [Geomicrobium halophilum]MBB6448228.1 xanthine dehydrogenase accessory factor [Geomicrobium halophilum]